MVGVPLRAWAVAVLACLAASLLAWAVPLLWYRARQRRYRREVEANLARLISAPGLKAAVEGGGVLRNPGRTKGWLPERAHGWAHFRAVEDLISQAAMDWSLEKYLVRSLAAAAACGMLALLASRSPVVAVGAFSLGALLPYLYLRRQRARRIAAFEEHFPEALDLLGRALRAGHPIATGLRMVAEEFPDPLSAEFRLAFEGQRYGLAFDDSLRQMARRIPIADVQIFTMAVLIQREIGGNLSEILDNLAQVIRQRFSLRRELRTYTAQGRMSGYVLAMLPIGLGGLLYLINREDMLAFIQDPLGRTMVTTAALMQVMGFLWIRRITNIEL